MIKTQMKLPDFSKSQKSEKNCSNLQKFRNKIKPFELSKLQKSNKIVLTVGIKYNDFFEISFESSEIQIFLKAQKPEIIVWAFNSTEDYLGFGKQQKNH